MLKYLYLGTNFLSHLCFSVFQMLSNCIANLDLEPAFFLLSLWRIPLCAKMPLYVVF